MEKETANWAAEYHSTLAEMEKSVREQLDASRPGSMALTVTNVSETVDGHVTVLLDGTVRQEIDVPDHLLVPVLPGEHVFTIRGKIGDTLRGISKAVRVQPGLPHLVTLTLPKTGAEA